MAGGLGEGTSGRPTSSDRLALHGAGRRAAPRSRGPALDPCASTPRDQRLARRWPKRAALRGRSRHRPRLAATSAARRARSAPSVAALRAASAAPSSAGSAARSRLAARVDRLRTHRRAARWTCRRSADIHANDDRVCRDGRHRRRPPLSAGRREPAPRWHDPALGCNPCASRGSRRATTRPTVWSTGPGEKIAEITGDPLYQRIELHRHRARGRRRAAARARHPAQQGDRHRPQLRRPRQGDGHRRPRRADDVPRPEHRGRRPRRPGRHAPADLGGRLRGRARRRHRPAVQGPRAGGRPRGGLRLHRGQRRDGPRPAARRRPVGPGQGVRHLLPARPVDRDRPRLRAASGSSPGSTARSCRTARRPTWCTASRALVSHASKAFTLLPGDVILTGTPAGVGLVEAGQRVEVEVDGIGVLSNPFVRH